MSGKSPQVNGGFTRRMQGVTDFTSFDLVSQIGEGTFGVVHKAKYKSDGRMVALKQLRLEHEKEGFPITAIREIKILKGLKRTKNIVELLEIAMCSNTKSIYLVFEYMDFDLNRVLTKTEYSLNPVCIKSMMKQIFEGLHAMHLKRIIHRDLKTANILINKEGELKLADFGLSKHITENSGKYTKKVVTLWYRPPELLLGASEYSLAIDIWGLGCIMAEMYRKEPLFKTTYEDNNEGQISQIFRVMELCGSPNEQNWPDVGNLQDYSSIKNVKKERTLRSRFKDLDENAFSILDQMLTLDPAQRPKVNALLDHTWFWEEPLPLDPQALKKELNLLFMALERVENAESRSSQSHVNSHSEPPLPHQPPLPHSHHPHPHPHPRPPSHRHQSHTYSQPYRGSSHPYRPPHPNPHPSQNHLYHTGPQPQYQNQSKRSYDSYANPNYPRNPRGDHGGRNDRGGNDYRNHDRYGRDDHYAKRQKFNHNQNPPQPPPSH